MENSHYCGECYQNLGDKGLLEYEDFKNHYEICPAIGDISCYEVEGKRHIVAYDRNGYPAFFKEIRDSCQKESLLFEEHIISRHIAADVFVNLCTCSYFSREGKADAKDLPGYIYLIKDPREGFSSYKIGIGGGNTRVKTDIRLAGHIEHGWHVVAVWSMPNYYEAHVKEQQILRSWRTSGKYASLRPSQMSQWGFSETVAINHWGRTQSLADAKIVGELDNIIQGYRHTDTIWVARTRKEGYILDFPSNRNMIQPLYLGFGVERYSSGGIVESTLINYPNVVVPHIKTRTTKSAKLKEIPKSEHKKLAAQLEAAGFDVVKDWAKAKKHRLPGFNYIP